MRYDNKTFTDETIALDGNEFHNCTFERCIVTYAGATPLEVHPFPDWSDVEVQFEGAAKWGALLQLHLLANGAEQAPKGAVIELGGRWWQEVDRPVDRRH